MEFPSGRRDERVLLAKLRAVTEEMFAFRSKAIRKRARYLWEAVRQRFDERVDVCKELLRYIEAKVCIDICLELLEAFLPCFEESYPGDDKPRTILRMIRDGVPEGEEYWSRLFDEEASYESPECGAYLCAMVDLVCGASYTDEPDRRAEAFTDCICGVDVTWRFYVTHKANPGLWAQAQSQLSENDDDDSHSNYLALRPFYRAEKRSRESIAKQYEVWTRFADLLERHLAEEQSTTESK